MEEESIHELEYLLSSTIMTLLRDEFDISLCLAEGRPSIEKEGNIKKNGETYTYNYQMSQIKIQIKEISSKKYVWTANISGDLCPLGLEDDQVEIARDAIEALSSLFFYGSEQVANTILREIKVAIADLNDGFRSEVNTCEIKSMASEVNVPEAGTIVTAGLDIVVTGERIYM